MTALALPVSFDPIFDTDTHAGGIRHQANHPMPRPQLDPTGPWANKSPRERAEAVRELGQRMTKREIAVELGTTMNSIAGVALRERISTARSIRMAPPALPVADPVHDQAWQPLPGSTPTTMTDADGCMWPVGLEGGAAQLFCNEPLHTHGRYCAAHYKRSQPRGGQNLDWLASRFNNPNINAVDDEVRTNIEDVLTDLQVDKKREVE